MYWTQDTPYKDSKETFTGGQSITHCQLPNIYNTYFLLDDQDET